MIARLKRVRLVKKAAREKLNNELNISQTATLVMQIGSGFKVKGVDRALRAIASSLWRHAARCITCWLAQVSPRPI